MASLRPICGRCLSCCTTQRSPKERVGLILILALAIIGVEIARAKGRIQATNVVVLTYTVLIGLICCIGCSALRASFKNRVPAQEKHYETRATEVVPGIENVGNLSKDGRNYQDNFYVLTTNGKNHGQTHAVNRDIFDPKTTNIGKLKAEFAKHLGENITNLTFFFSGKLLKDNELLSTLEPQAKSEIVLQCMVKNGLVPQ